MSVAISRFKTPERVAATPLVRDHDLQRANGEASIGLRSVEGRTEIAQLYQSAPCRILMPRIDGQASGEVVFANTSGGIAGGDRLVYGASVEGPLQAIFTTQAAEKVYRALDSAAHIETTLKASDGAFLQWLPQPTIVFDGARLRRRTHVDIRANSRLLALEWLILGREQHGETLSSGSLRDDWRICVDGRLVWADALRLDGDIAALTGRAALLGGNRALATIIYAGPRAPTALEDVRNALAGLSECIQGASLVGGVIVARLAARSADVLYACVCRLLARMADALGASAPWPPRLWAS